MLWWRPTSMGTSCRESCWPTLPDQSFPNWPSRDAAAALVGSLGLVPSVNAGDSFVMGEPYVPSQLRATYGYQIFLFPHFAACTALLLTSKAKELRTL